MRIKLRISYDGSKFSGYAKQPKTNTVFNNLYKALNSLGIYDEPVCAGRTDKGVHALNQILALDIHIRWISRLNELKNLLNQKLQFIYIKEITKVNDNFNPRFDAKHRTYRYIISDKSKNPFSYNYISFIKPYKKDVLKKLTPLFKGIHNFKYFQKTGTEHMKSIREIYEAKFYTYKDYGIFVFKANGFLRSQIRFMVGILLEISNGNLKKNQLIQQLNVKKRYCSKLAPPNGLYLLRMKYDIK